MKYIPKVFLIFKLPDGSNRQGFFRKNQTLGDILASLGIEGEIQLDQTKNIGQLNLKNDDVVEVK